MRQRAGTDATDPQSRLAIVSTRWTADQKLSLRWLSVAGRHYQLQAKEGLPASGWIDVSPPILAGGP